MKKICCIILTLAVISLTEARAQQKVEVCIGTGYCSESFQTLNVFVNYSYGLFESPNFFIGIGSGLHYYLGPGYAIPGGEYHFSLSNHYQEWAIPAFCHVQFNLAKQKVTPFVGAKTGVNIPVVVRDYEKDRRSGMLFCGFFFEPLIGVSFGGDDRKKISTSIVSPFIELRNTIKETACLSRSLMVSICYSF